MSDYEEQNSSEYKDPAPASDSGKTGDSDRNSQDSGFQPDSYTESQNRQPSGNPEERPSWHDGQIPPDHRQNPHWQNGQIPPNNGQPPYWQNGQIPPNNGQPPYWQNQPQPPKREKNSFASLSLFCGIFALLTLCCFAFPLAIICGVGAICFAVMSKRNQPFRGTAVAGIFLGAIAVFFGIGEFFYMMAFTNLMKDPANAAAFNELFTQIQQQFGLN